jgi:hypothetical protein
VGWLVILSAQQLEGNFDQHSGRRYGMVEFFFV